MKRFLVLVTGLLALLSASAPAAKCPRPPVGSIVAWMSVPRIHVSARVVEGRNPAQLDRGPSHAPESGLPPNGRPILIAGHRTTYGAWFRHIDELQKHDKKHQGDIIIVRWKKKYGGTIRYRITGKKVVRPEAEFRLLHRRGDMLILSACDPPGSDAERLVVFAYPTRR